MFILGSHKFCCPFHQFLGIFSSLLVCFFFLFALFLHQPVLLFCSFILVKVVFHFLEISSKFLLILTLCYSTQFMSIIFS